MQYEIISSHLNRLIRAERVAGMTFDRHMHYSFEFFYIVSGEVECTVEQTKYRLMPGEAILILPNQIHSYFTRKPSDCIMFIFAPVYVNEFFKSTIGKEFIHPVFRLPYNEVENHPAIGDIFEWKSLLYHICAAACRQCKMQPSSTKNHELIQSIAEYIYRNLNEKISLEQLASQFGYSYHYLSACIKSYFGMNFCTLVNHYRIDLAATLLYTTDLSITEVAGKSGFSTIRSFNRAFKSIHGVTPTVFLQSKEKVNL